MTDDSIPVTAAASMVPVHSTRVGPYTILQTIGEGGMGIVYLAQQEQPIRRRVAVKVIKTGLDSRQVIGRFEAERQALARMDHPAIAAVYDAGSTEDGRPYFVMEHVPGLPITNYCDRHRLATEERLGLFTQVCAGIQHAHQKGVIHRDIKPSNVLVAVLDDRPVVKIIDFGVAKATEHDLTERTLFTEHGMLVGTPEYMSPEQAEMSAADIDTRTDIYSLGVLLYELLVGGLPFDPQRLRRAGYMEIQRIIREEEPERPSTRLSRLGEKATEVASRRQTDPDRLTRELRGDLDWITLRSMEKDRTRRYGTASELSAEITRYLHDEPVAARAPTLRYRAQKFVRRNQLAVVAASVVLLTILVALIGTAAMYLRAEREARRNRAEAGAMVAWVDDMTADRRDLPTYLPRARESISLQRELADEQPADFAARLMMHHYLSQPPALFSPTTPEVRRFQLDTSRELLELLLRTLTRNDRRVLDLFFKRELFEELWQDHGELWHRVLEQALKFLDTNGSRADVELRGQIQRALAKAQRQ